MLNSKFETPIEMVVKVPLDFNPDTCIDDNAKIVKGKSTTYGYNNNLTSANFANASNKLVAGKEYLVKLIPIKSGVVTTSQENLDEVSRNNGILVGGQALTVLDRNKLPKGKAYISMDNSENLWKDSVGCHGVPSLHARSDGDFRWDLGCFEDGWDDDCVLVCFCEYEKAGFFFNTSKDSFLNSVEIVKDGSIIFT